MKTSTLAVALLSCSLLPVGCSKTSVEHATADQCRKACERVARLQTAAYKAKVMGNLHELDEKVERTEDEQERNVDLLQKQLAAGGPWWDEAAVKKLPEARRRGAIEQHRWEERELRQQREVALQRAQAQLVDVKKEYKDAEAKADVDLKAATESAVGACQGPCQKRPVAGVECLLRVQALEDLEICNKP